MSRRIAFYLPRENQLKVIAPLVKYLVDHCADEFRPLILIPGWKTSKSKPQPNIGELRALFGDPVELIQLEDAMALLRLIQARSIDAVLNLTVRVCDMDLATTQLLRDESRKRGTTWIALPYLFAGEEVVLEDPALAVELWDRICVVGLRSVEYLESHLNGTSDHLGQRLLERVRVTGYPELDGFNQLSDAEGIRRKYGFPLERPIIFVATAPKFYPLVNGSRMLQGLEARFRHDRAGALRSVLALATCCRYPVLVSYRDYLKALRIFADANGACLVAKTREKHRDPDYLREYVDYIVDDRSFFPFTTLELLRISRLYVGFYSATAMEAAAAGVYAISILFLPKELVEPLPSRRARSGFFHSNPGGLWNTPGVSEVIDGTTRSGSAWLDRLARSRLEEYAVDERQRMNLLDQFVSCVGNSSAQVVEVLRESWS